ncbi:MAG TPA: hypothetical protein PK402_00830 [Tepidisphaeraceae bacterium]|nr:hypothetical protein [Tepidisphaeraceae bacterium]
MKTLLSRIFGTITFLAVALWVGSLAHLMLSVGTLFSKFPKASSDVAMQGAPALFNVSEPVHLALGIIAVVSSLMWKATSKSLGPIVISGLVVIGLIFAGISIGIVTPQINALREAGMSSSDDFDFWHRTSTKLYMVQFIGVLGAVICLPWALWSSLRTTPKADPA